MTINYQEVKEMLLKEYNSDPYISVENVLDKFIGCLTIGIGKSDDKPGETSTIAPLTRPRVPLTLDSGGQLYFTLQNEGSGAVILIACDEEGKAKGWGRIFEISTAGYGSLYPAIDPHLGLQLEINGEIQLV